MGIGVQLLTIVSVITGGLISLTATTIAERIKWSRDYRTKWSDRKFEAYEKFAKSISSSTAISRGLAASRHLMSGPLPISVDNAKEKQLVVNLEIAQAYETVRLIGNNRVVNAADMLRFITWELCDAALGAYDITPAEWEDLYLRYREYRSAFYIAARVSLGIPGVEHELPPADQNSVSRIAGARESGYGDRD